MTGPTPRQWLAVPAIWGGLAGLVLGATRGAVTYALAVAFGPLAGGFVRDGQSCCAQFSYVALPFAAGLLALGVASAFLLGPTTRARRALRWTLWVTGWVGWFLAAPYSYLHALE